MFVKGQRKIRRSNGCTVCYAHWNITAQFVTHLLSGIEFSGEMWYNGGQQQSEKLGGILWLKYGMLMTATSIK